MRTWFKRPITQYVSAPMVVTAGMVALILGGLAGSAMLFNHHPDARLMNSAFAEAPETAPVQSAQQLKNDIAALKAESAELINTTRLADNASAQAFLGLAESTIGGRYMPRRDPFAPVAPPPAATTLAAEDDSLPVETPRPPARVRVPGDNAVPMVSNAIENSSEEEALEIAEPPEAVASTAARRLGVM